MGAIKFTRMHLHALTPTCRWITRSHACNSFAEREKDDDDELNNALTERLKKDAVSNLLLILYLILRTLCHEYGCSCQNCVNSRQSFKQTK